MGKKSSPPRSPDLQPIADAQLAASKEAMELAREQMGLSKEQWTWFQENAGQELALARQQADRAFGLQERFLESDEETQKIANAVGQQQLAAMQDQMGWARADRERYEDVFLPMQDRMIAEAEAYATPERREAEAAKIGVDIQRQAEAQRANADARLRSMGVDPSQVRSTSMANQMGVATAANQALGMNQAREYIDDKGRAMRADAVNFGSGLPMQSLQGFGAAGAAGAGAIGAAQAGQNAGLAGGNAALGAGGAGLGFRNSALQQYGALTGTPMQWAGMSNNTMGMGGNFMNSAVGTENSQYANRYQRWQGVQEQGQRWFDNVGSVVNSVASFFAEGGEVLPRHKVHPRNYLNGGGMPMMTGGQAEETKDRKGAKRAAESAQQQGNIARNRAQAQAEQQRAEAAMNASRAEASQLAGGGTLIDTSTQMAQSANAARQIQLATAGGGQGVNLSHMNQQPVNVEDFGAFRPGGTYGQNTYTDQSSLANRDFNFGATPGATSDSFATRDASSYNFAEGGEVFDPMGGNRGRPGEGFGGGGSGPAAQYSDIVRGGGAPALQRGFNKGGQYGRNLTNRPTQLPDRRMPYSGNNEVVDRNWNSRNPAFGQQPGGIGPQRPQNWGERGAMGARPQDFGQYQPRGIGPQRPQNFGQQPGGIGPQRPQDFNGPGMGFVDRAPTSPGMPWGDARYGMNYQQPVSYPQQPAAFMAEGGTARGALPVRQSRDKIAAYLAEGEYVIPADVVRSVGIEKLDKMVAKYHRPGA